MKLSIIIPIYNEINTIKEVLHRVISLGMDKEIIVIDDNSTDGTREILEKYYFGNGIKVIYQNKNMGKGKAMRTGLEHCTGDIVVIQDADLELNPCELVSLTEIMTKQNINVIYGSRFLLHNPRLYWQYWLGNKIFSILIYLLTGKRITDPYTCYKMMKREVFQDLQIESNGFEVEMEITIKLLNKGYDILELPISYNPRTLEEGKKIGWKDAFKGVYTLFKYLRRIKDVKMGRNF